MMSSLMPQISEFDENVDLIRHVIYNQIRRYNLEFREEFGQMILCMDHTNNWRKQTFPLYKANRKKNRKNDDHDWDNIYRVLDEIREELVNKSPFNTIRIEGAEADDIIGAICELNNNPEPILIVSPDKDFVQLQRYPNVKQWSNLQKKWVEPDQDAVSDLEMKVLRGDTGDGVPNVLSEDNVLIEEGLRQVPLSKKKVAMLLQDPEALGTTVARRIIRNRNMIDLTRTPENIKTESMKQLQEGAKGSVTGLMTVFTKHKMKLHMESLPDFEVRN